MHADSPNTGETTLKRLLTFAACAGLLVACSPQKPAQPATPPKFDTSLSIKEVMGDIVDPASFVYWRGSGTEVTAKGERDLSPTTEDGWIQLENAAAVVMEAGNMLQLAGRARAPESHWNAYAQQLTERALAAREAAMKKDRKAVFDEGGRLYEVCTACHKEYVIDPGIKANGPAQGNPLPELPAAAGQKTHQAKTPAT